MKYMLILVFAFGLSLLSCKKDETCHKNCHDTTNYIIMDIENCKCICHPYLGFPMVDFETSSRVVCGSKGGFVAKLARGEERMWADTFSIAIRNDINPLDQMVKTAGYTVGWFTNSLNVQIFPLAQGDSIVIDSLPVPISSNSQVYLPNANTFEAAWKGRLRLEGFIPLGVNEGDRMHATIHHLDFINDKVLSEPLYVEMMRYWENQK